MNNTSEVWEKDGEQIVLVGDTSLNIETLTNYFNKTASLIANGWRKTL